jgi:hypothetical protein
VRTSGSGDHSVGAAAIGLAPRRLLPVVSAAQDAAAARLLLQPQAGLAALLQPAPAVSAPAPAPLHTVLQGAAAAPPAPAAGAPATARCWPEDAYVSAALAALQGAPGPSALTPGDAPFVASPYTVPPTGVAAATWGGLPLLPPPYTQMEQLLSSAADDCTSSTARFATALRHAARVDACASGAVFVPLVINDASGHAAAAAAVGAPAAAAAAAARLLPLDCPGLGPLPLRSQLAYVAAVANQARWVRWVCDAVTRLALTGGAGADVSRAVAATVHDGAAAASPPPPVPTGLLRFGPAAAQLAAGLRQLVDDISLDAACVQAAAHDRLMQLQRRHQRPTQAAAFSASAVLASEAMSSQSALDGDNDDDEEAHPRLTLTGLVAWLRRYAPLLQLAVSLCRNCLLRAPDAGAAAPAASGDGGPDDGPAALARRHGASTSSPACLIDAFVAASDAVFPAWAAATCVNALTDALQLHASLSPPPGVAGGAGGVSASSSGSSARSLTMPLSHLPEPPSPAAAALRLLLTVLQPYLRSLDAFAMGADAPPASLELPFSAADAASASAVRLLQWVRACVATASAGGRAVEPGADDAHRGVSPQQLLFDGTDGSPRTGAARTVDADDVEWARLRRAADDAHSAACALDAPHAGLQLLPLLAPAFLRAAATRSVGTPPSSAGAGALPSSVAAMVLQARTYRAVLTAVDHAAEGRGAAAGVLMPGGAPVGDDGSASLWGFGTLLFAPLETSFRARLAATLAPEAAAVGDSGDDDDDGGGGGGAPRRGLDVELLDSSFEDDTNDAASAGTRQHAVGDSDRLPAMALSDLHDLDSGDIAGGGGGGSDAATASSTSVAAALSVAGTTSTVGPLPLVAAVLAAGSVAPSALSTARSVGAPAASVSAAGSAHGGSGGSVHDLTAVTIASTRPVFQPGYVVPQPGAKRSAWWDIDAQVDVKKLQAEAEEAERASKARGAGGGGSGNVHDEDGGASVAVSTVAGVPSSAASVVSTDSLSVVGAVGRPPRPGAHGAGARQWGPAPAALHTHGGGGDMSAILEETAETDGDDSGGGGGESGSDDMSDSELGLPTDRSRDGGGGDVTGASGGRGAPPAGAPIDGAAAVAAFVVVDGVGRGPPVEGAHPAPAAPSTFAAAPAQSALQHAGGRSGGDSDDWLLPEHVWAADGPAQWSSGSVRLLPPFGSRSEWDAVTTLLYPHAPAAAVAGDACWSTGAPHARALDATPHADAPADQQLLLPNSAAATVDLRCERVASVLRRDLVGVLAAQHRLLTRAVTWALLQRLHLLRRHLWGLRAVCLFEQADALAGFTGPLFAALESGRARDGGGSGGALAVRDSYRLTTWLQSALASGLPSAHLPPAHGGGGGGGGAADVDGDEEAQPHPDGARPPHLLHPPDFSITFTGFAAATDGELLSSGLALSYEPARHFPLSLVLDPRAMGDYRALFGHVLAVRHAAAVVAAATRRAALAARQLHAALGPPLPLDAGWAVGVRAGAHEAHLLLGGLGHFTRSLHGHTAHALLTAPWDELTAALARLADGSVHGGGADGDDGGGGAAASVVGGLPAIRAAHSAYLATLRRLCLLGGDGQRAAAAAQRMLLQRACDGAALVDGWFASAVAGATAARRAAGLDAAGSDARALRRLPLADDAAAAAAAALAGPLAAGAGGARRPGRRRQRRRRWRRRRPPAGAGRPGHAAGPQRVLLGWRCRAVVALRAVHTHPHQRYPAVGCNCLCVSLARRHGAASSRAESRAGSTRASTRARQTSYTIQRHAL